MGEDDQLSWRKIKIVEKMGQEEVFDIEVEGTHTFVGNGIVAHNTFAPTSRARGHNAADGQVKKPGRRGKQYEKFPV